MGVTTIHALIEDWIQIRRTLQQQLKLLEAEKHILGDATDATIVRIKRWIQELNSLLKEHARADRP